MPTGLESPILSFRESFGRQPTIWVGFKAS